jgi:hypothetical protein
MADEITPEVRTQRMKEFLSMLPLTLELAGLPKCAPGSLFNEGQMEVRVTVVRNAYKLAHQLIREIGEKGVNG